MGNSASHAKADDQLSEPLLHSFPRKSRSKIRSQHKVLPERNAHLKLRPTGNGEILHSGGTISGRHARLKDEIIEEKKTDCTTSLEDCSYNEDYEIPIDYDNSRTTMRQENKMKPSSQEIKSFGSEPDLRQRGLPENKSKKKYKAPSPPIKHNVVTQNKSTINEDLLNPRLPIRKARLFKTRAETKKQSSHFNEYPNEFIDNTSSGSKTNKPKDKKESNRFTTNDFYKELKDVTTKLRRVKVDKSYEKEPNTSSKTKLKTLDPNTASGKDLKEKLLVRMDKNPIMQCTREEASGKESTPDMSPSHTLRNGLAKDTKDPTPKHHFFFGMDKVKHKPENLLHPSQQTESEISSDIESEENDMCRLGIDLQLRPILPKKQLEIPRFSPSAAWRLLSMDANDNTSTMVSDDVPLMMEEHIEKYSRPPPPLAANAGQRSNDKSGDSGISGDDLDPLIQTIYYDEVDTDTAAHQKKLPVNSYKKPERLSWTPQQDLEDESSTEEELLNNKAPNQKPRQHVGPHTFSLSLPRDNRFSTYITEKNHMPSNTGLQKFKKSLTGVLGNLGNNKNGCESTVSDDKDDNWFLSKSAPNSLTQTIQSLERHKKQEIEEQSYPQNVNTASRLIYLPEIESPYPRDKFYQRSIKQLKCAGYSKSCEDIGSELDKMYPERLQDSNDMDKFYWKTKPKSKKYTFQSTIRQIEKKRLSDKLSKEAERRERKRLKEFEAMQKVEQEFEKKRAREKANIKQQLRLFSMDTDNGWHSLPPNFEVDQKDRRSEPDGAFSSISSSSSSTKNYSNQVASKISNFDNKPPSGYTQELSEYRQTQRNYKDYNSNMKYNTDKIYSPKQTTVHPQVSCNMPKVTANKMKQEHNYRKEFAAGVRGLLSSPSSHSEESQSQFANSQHRNKMHGPGYYNNNVGSG